MALLTKEVPFFREQSYMITYHPVDSIIQDGIEISNFTYCYAYDTKVAEDNLKASSGMNIEDEGILYLINIEGSAMMKESRMRQEEENEYRISYGRI